MWTVLYPDKETPTEQNGDIRDYMYTYVNNVNIHAYIADVHKLISKAHWVEYILTGIIKCKNNWRKNLFAKWSQHDSYFVFIIIIIHYLFLFPVSF